MVLQNLSNVQLANISVVGGMLTAGFAYFVRNRLSDNIERQPYCREPLKLLRNHAGANYILGQGFQIKGIMHESFTENTNEMEDNLRYYFPVAGKDGQGTFTIYSKCEGAQENRHCHVKKCFLEVRTCATLGPEQYEGKQLVIYDREKHGPLTYENKKPN